ncbi:MAG: SufD family Fe-S cluster assembly protein [Bacteroidia bacterium]|nr:SufD family Fe-S cluster assembly protein [Bacteroidia bacterium]MCX7652109.1 SufD family Fe-S cluster assembly protein [Bacteroidia bacterium]MDW8417499.1 SufD family Fe-S cluster assembly protein [Bacteroidia bacterium]
MASTLTQDKLSLEAGASHLTNLFRALRDAQVIPSPLRSKSHQWVSDADLLTLFTEQALKEDWKYTPMDFFRYAWDYVPFQTEPLHIASQSAFSSKSPLSLAEVERIEALRSFPEPLSPWEALLSGIPAQLHYRLVDGERLAFTLRNPGSLSAQLITVSLPAHAEAEIGFSIKGEGFSLLRFHLHLGEGAQLRLYYLSEDGSESTYRYLILTSYLEKNASIATYDFTTEVGWKRSEYRVRLAGEGASAHLHGAAYVREHALVDTAIRVEHFAPHTESNQLFKSLVQAKGRSAFQGRIFVDRVAQKTNAYQSHKALLIAPTAVAYSRPQLEIFADDVRCTHGVTTGFLQGDMLMYLRARGIPEPTARQMLYRAFLTEVVEKVPEVSLRSWIDNRLSDVIGAQS